MERPALRARAALVVLRCCSAGKLDIIVKAENYVPLRCYPAASSCRHLASVLDLPLQQAVSVLRRTNKSSLASLPPTHRRPPEQKAAPQLVHPNRNTQHSPFLQLHLGKDVEPYKTW